MNAETRTIEGSANETLAFWLTRTYRGDGTIRNGKGNMLLAFMQHGRETRFWAPSLQDAFIVRRQGWAPFSRWLVYRVDVPVCVVRRRGLWRNKYALDLAGGKKWTVRFPLFTVRYTCTSDQGEQFHVQLVQHTTWLVEQFPASGDISLLVGLSTAQEQRMSA
jgi:hypothetical protein